MTEYWFYKGFMLHLYVIIKYYRYIYSGIATKKTLENTKEVIRSVNRRTDGTMAKRKRHYDAGN
jgi:hypothetical protein